MLIAVRGIKTHRLRYRNALDIEYNMYVRETKEGSGKYVIRLSNKYLLDEVYDSQEEAEEDMRELAETVNRLEEEQRERNQAPADA